jgi:hypothetical protein
VVYKAWKLIEVGEDVFDVKAIPEWLGVAVSVQYKSYAEAIELRVRSTNKTALEFAMKTLHCGQVRRCHKAKPPIQVAIYALEVTKFKDVVRILALALPFMAPERQEKFQKCVDLYAATHKKASGSGGLLSSPMGKTKP